MKNIWNSRTQASLVTLLALYAAGLAAGILFANLTFPFRDGSADVLAAYLADRLKDGIVPSREYFLYLLERRSAGFLCFMLAGMTAAARPAIWLGAAGAGFLTGAAQCMALLQSGIRGMLLLSAAGFPQYLFYGPSMVSLWLLADQKGGKIWKARAGLWKTYLWGSFLCYLGLLAGIFLEAYGNPYFLKWFFGWF